MINACLAGFFCVLINLQPFHAVESVRLSHWEVVWMDGTLDANRMGGYH